MSELPTSPEHHPLRPTLEGAAQTTLTIQHTITTLLLTASVVGGAALLSGTRTQLEQFRRDVGEIQHVVHGVASTWDEFSEVP
jgi:hypothetical protein